MTDAWFQPYAHGDGTKRAPLAAEVVLVHGDGAADLRVQLAGGETVIPRVSRGHDPGEWWPVEAAAPAPPTPELVPVTAVEPLPPPEPLPLSAKLARAKPAALPVIRERAAGLNKCKLCMRLHRTGDYMYCSDACRDRAGVGDTGIVGVGKRQGRTSA